VTTYTLGLTRTIGHGRAFSQLLRPASPAAGAGLTLTPSGNYWFLGDSLSFTLATNSTAALRSVTFQIQDADGTPIATVPSALTVTASTTANYTYLSTVNGESGFDNGPILNVYPQLFVQPGYKLLLTVNNVQTGDQLSGIRHYVQRFDTGDSGYLIGPVSTTDPDFEQIVRDAQVLA
jgi:hypothetical protein